MEGSQITYEVLYTHQKTKKAKTWQDGTLRISGTKAVLYDDKKSKIDTVHINGRNVDIGEEMESDRFLIQVESLTTLSCDPGQSGSHHVTTVVKPPPPAHATVAHKTAPPRMGLKRKRTGFQPPRQLNAAPQQSQSEASNSSQSHPVLPSVAFSPHPPTQSIFNIYGRSQQYPADTSNSEPYSQHSSRLSPAHSSQPMQHSESANYHLRKEEVLQKRNYPVDSVRPSSLSKSNSESGDLLARKEDTLQKITYPVSKLSETPVLSQQTRDTSSVIDRMLRDINSSDKPSPWSIIGKPQSLSLAPSTKVLTTLPQHSPKIADPISNSESVATLPCFNSRQEVHPPKPFRPKQSVEDQNEMHAVELQNKPEKSTQLRPMQENNAGKPAGQATTTKTAAQVLAFLCGNKAVVQETSDNPSRQQSETFADSQKIKEDNDQNIDSHLVHPDHMSVKSDYDEAALNVTEHREELSEDRQLEDSAKCKSQFKTSSGLVSETSSEIDITCSNNDYSVLGSHNCSNISSPACTPENVSVAASPQSINFSPLSHVSPSDTENESMCISVTSADTCKFESNEGTLDENVKGIHSENVLMDTDAKSNVEAVDWDISNEKLSIQQVNYEDKLDSENAVISHEGASEVDEKQQGDISGSEEDQLSKTAEESLIDELKHTECESQNSRDTSVLKEMNNLLESHEKPPIDMQSVVQCISLNVDTDIVSSNTSSSIEPQQSLVLHGSEGNMCNASADEPGEILTDRSLLNETVNILPIPEPSVENSPGHPTSSNQCVKSSPPQMQNAARDDDVGNDKKYVCSGITNNSEDICTINTNSESEENLTDPTESLCQLPIVENDEAMVEDDDMPNWDLDFSPDFGLSQVVLPSSSGVGLEGSPSPSISKFNRQLNIPTSGGQVVPKSPLDLPKDNGECIQGTLTQESTLSLRSTCTVDTLCITSPDSLDELENCEDKVRNIGATDHENVIPDDGAISSPDSMQIMSTGYLPAKPCLSPPRAVVTKCPNQFKSAPSHNYTRMDSLDGDYPRSLQHDKRKENKSIESDCFPNPVLHVSHSIVGTSFRDLPHPSQLCKSKAVANDEDLDKTIVQKVSDRLQEYSYGGSKKSAAARRVPSSPTATIHSVNVHREQLKELRPLNTHFDTDGLQNKECQNPPTFHDSASFDHHKQFLFTAEDLHNASLSMKENYEPGNLVLRPTESNSSKHGDTNILLQRNQGNMEFSDRRFQPISLEAGRQPLTSRFTEEQFFQGKKSMSMKSPGYSDKSSMQQSKPFWMQDSPVDCSFDDSFLCSTNEELRHVVDNQHGGVLHSLRSVTDQEKKSSIATSQLLDANTLGAENSRWDKYHASQSPTQLLDSDYSTQHPNQVGVRVLSHGVDHLKPIKSDAKNTIELTSDMSEDNFSQDSFDMTGMLESPFDNESPARHLSEDKVTLPRKIDKTMAYPSCDNISRSVSSSYFTEQKKLDKFEIQSQVKLNHRQVSNSAHENSYIAESRPCAAPVHVSTPFVGAGGDGSKRGFKPPRALGGLSLPTPNIASNTPINKGQGATGHTTQHRVTNDPSKGFIWPSNDEVSDNSTRTREVAIKPSYSSVAEYQQLLSEALIEYLNVQLYQLAQCYHNILGKVDTSGYCPNAQIGKGRSSSIVNSNPACEHGLPSKMVQVRKEGANKDRFFYACNGQRNQQCKFFKWTDEMKGCKSNSSVQSKALNLDDPGSIMTYFKGQGVKMYCECYFLRKVPDNFNDHLKNCPPWIQKYRKQQGYSNTATKRTYIQLSRREASSHYAKDDLWVVSQTLNFDPSSTFIAKSCFYGPSTNNEVEIEPIGKFSPSNWPSESICHCLHVGNVSTELGCLSNIKEFVNTTTMPILPALLNTDGQLSSGSAKFHMPSTVQSFWFSTPEEFVLNEAEKLIKRFELNEDQSKALRQIAAMFNTDPTAMQVALIHGVFGAGKSFLLAVVVQFLVTIFLEHDMYSSTGEPLRVLISSTTNVAVDRILQGLLQLGFDDFVRVGSIKKIAKPVLPYSVHATGTDSQELKDLQEMLKSEDITPSEGALVRKSIEQHKKGENKKKLGRVRVVGVTCAACGFQCLKDLKFSVVLLDECSQMTEPASLLPIAKFNCHRLVLVGDPKQLSPTIQSSDSSHEEGLEQTMFDRLLRMGYAATMLRTQYRCHPRISAVANSLFYSSQLRNGITNQDRPPLAPSWPALCFFDVPAGQEQSSSSTASFYNPQEASFVVSLIDALVRDGVEPCDIGVITLYKAQLQWITKCLMESNLTSHSEIRSIQISTVDAFQGGERGVIILSTVRTKAVGFIDCHKRTNVALTRAKSHLLIVGHRRNLQQNPLWGAVIRHCAAETSGMQNSGQFLKQLEEKISDEMVAQEEANLEVTEREVKKTITNTKRKRLKLASAPDGAMDDDSITSLPDLRDESIHTPEAQIMTHLWGMDCSMDTTLPPPPPPEQPNNSHNSDPCTGWTGTDTLATDSDADSPMMGDKPVSDKPVSDKPVSDKPVSKKRKRVAVLNADLFDEEVVLGEEDSEELPQYL